MMAEAAAIGIPSWRFWHQTPRETQAAVRGAKKRHLSDHRLAAYGAWQAEWLARQKRLPSLADIQRKLDPRKNQTPTEMRAAIIGAARAMGAKVTVRKKE